MPKEGPKPKNFKKEEGDWRSHAQIRRFSNWVLKGKFSIVNSERNLQKKRKAAQFL